MIGTPPRLARNTQTWPRRYAQFSALGGLVVWLALSGRTWRSPDAMFLFAPLVLVPLALSCLVRSGRRAADVLLRAALALQFPSAILLALAHRAVDQGVALAFALPWLVETAILALAAAARFFPRGPGPPEELAIDTGLAFAFVGGVWSLAWAAGVPLLGYGLDIVALTAIHFHYAAFVLPVIGGLIGRCTLPRGAGVERWFRALAAGLIVGPPLLAAGIALSRRLEQAAAIVVVLTAAQALLFAATVGARRARIPVGARIGLVAALVPLSFSMAFVVLFAFGRTDVPTMVAFHGPVNAYLVSFVALAVFSLSPPVGRAPADGPPMSRLRSVKTTGPDFFERIQGIDVGRPSPTGLTDDWGRYGRRGFDPATTAPEIRAFYEHTQDHSLVVVPRLRTGFRLLGRAYAAFARRAGQMAVPFDTATDGERVKSRIVAVKDALDGRTNVRAWIRTYARDGRPLYVAAYSTHQRDGQTYMNIAFPFPGWNLTSILRLDAAPNGALRLSSRPTYEEWGDQGVYFASKRLRIRLPINETIDVWLRDDPAAPVRPLPPSARPVRIVARHTIWVFGVRALLLDYHIDRMSAVENAALATSPFEDVRDR